MSAQHTPGPWQTRASRDLSGDIAVTASAGIVAECFMAIRTHDEHGVEVEANARLIASAPDLLEELEQQADGTSTIISLLEGQQGAVAVSLRGILKIQEQAARAIIALATGEKL